MSIPRGRRLLVGASVVALLVGAVSAPGAAAGSRAEGGKLRFGYGGTGCVESIVQTPVDTDRLAPFVPDDFQVIEDVPGKARLVVAIISCDEISVNGSRPRPGVFSDVGVRIVSPDGSGGAHFYEIWQVQNLTSLHAKMRGVGVFGSLDRAATHSFDALGPLTVSGGAVHWREAPYAIDVVTTPHLGDPDGGNHWWHLGRHGLVRIAYQFTNVEVAPGKGRLETRSGTHLAEMVGADSAEGIGFNIRLDFEGVVEVVESAMNE